MKRFFIVMLFFITSISYSQNNIETDNVSLRDSIRNSVEYKEALLEKLQRSQNYQLKLGNDIKKESSNKTNMLTPDLFNIQTFEVVDLVREKNALITFYNALYGDRWTNNSGWKSAVVSDDWYGITVDENGSVIKIELSNNHVGDYWSKPAIPDIFDALPNLQVLDLSYNYDGDDLISGDVPLSISNLQYLEILNLASLNELTGKVSLTNLENLRILNLGNCTNVQLDLDKEIGDLRELTLLDLSGVDIRGQIHQEIGNLTNLEYLSFHGVWSDFCYFPSGFKSLINLKELHFGWGFGFENCFDINTLDNLPPNLEYIDFTYSGISGNLPTSFGGLSKLKYFDASYNNLVGDLPESMNNLDSLEKLYLQNNSLSGDLPFELIGQLTNIHISSNFFSFENFLQFVDNSLISYRNQGQVDKQKIHNPVEGQRFSLTTNIDRNTDPPSKFQWFRADTNQPWIQGEPLIPEPTYDGHTFSFDLISEEANGFYYYKITNEEASDLTLRSQMQEIEIVEPCLDFDFDYYPSPTCGVLFVPVIQDNIGCEILNYFWDFGDGDTSSIQEPLHVYNTLDTFNVTLTIAYDCQDTCSGQIPSITKQIDLRESIFDSLTTVTVETKLIDSVLNASSTTFSDSWFVPYDNELIRKKNPYLNGSKGVWRNNANYVYREDRHASSSVNVSQDGTYPLESFNWPMAQYEAIPGWLKSNTVTQYSPYSFELENQDILGNYSAAIYSYGGQMPVAVGQNMANEEMAYTGFEELDSDGFAIVHDASRRGSGNWSLSIDDQKPFTKEFEVKVGYGNLALMNEPIESFEGIDTVSVLAIYFTDIQIAFITFPLINYKRLDDVAIWCKESYGEFDENTILTFDQVIHDETWYGTIIYSKPATTGIVSNVSEDIAHTGTKSLKIAENKVISQEYLELEQGKEYILSAWASINDKHLYVPVLGENLGIRMQFYDSADALIHDELLEPSGNIIEGWQKIERKFMYPEGAVRFETSFEKGTASILYLDDLRLFPAAGNMQSYVYELNTYRLHAVMDENNYASLYYYDPEGNLYLVKKETEEGLKAIQESTGYQMQTGGE